MIEKSHYNLYTTIYRAARKVKFYTNVSCELGIRKRKIPWLPTTNTEHNASKVKDRTSKMNKRASRMNKRASRKNNRISKMNNRISKMNERMSVLNETINKQKTKARLRKLRKIKIKTCAGCPNIIVGMRWQGFTVTMNGRRVDAKICKECHDDNVKV